MILDWTKHLSDPAKKAEFEKEILNSRHVLSRLKDLLDERKRAVESSELSVKDFETPNWSEKQAFRNGFKSCLSIVHTILDLDRTNIKFKE